jgi:DNA-binding response OmpR family regulator
VWIAKGYQPDADGVLRRLPVLAITSLSGEEAERRGREAGVDGYLVKLDREKILAEVEKLLLRRGPR